MKKLSGWRKAFAVSGTAGILAFGGIFYGSVTVVWAAPTAAKAVSDNILVRDSAVSGAQVGSLVEDQEVTIQSETTGSDGNTWYEITFELNGENITGWVRSDLVTAADAAEGSEENDFAIGTEPDAGTFAVHFELDDGYVDIEDVPEEQAALVSDRFVERQCAFEGSIVSAYQLASPDALVADDADLTNFYYVYGVNDIGEEGWYTYDSSSGTLQKNIVNMTYSPGDVQENPAEVSGVYEADTFVRMIISALCLVCLLLLVLAIIFSVRYRRLRNILEADIEKEDTSNHPDEVETPEKAVKREKKAKAQKPAKAESKNKKSKGIEPENILELHTPGGDVDLWDLDSIEDGKEQMNTLNGTQKKPDVPVEDDGEYDISDTQSEEYDDELERILRSAGEEIRAEEESDLKNIFGDGVDKTSKAEDDELERILREESMLFTEKKGFDPEDVFSKEHKPEKKVSESGFYDEEENADDDLEFL